VAHTVAVYRRLLGDVVGLGEADLVAAGERVAASLDGFGLGDLRVEVEAIAAGAGVDAGVLLAVNARTELLVGTRGGGECSLLGRVAGGGCRLAQNWDWHPDLAASVVCWTVAQPGGRWFATLTEAGILAKLGLSSAGVCCGLNFLASSLDRGVHGLPVHVLLRVLLDRCESFSGALEWLRSTPVGASACITVGWADGVEAAIASAELSPGGCRLLWPRADGAIAHCNHFLQRVNGAEDLELAGPSSTLMRQWRLEIPVVGGPIEAALRSHLGAPLSICRHDVPGVAWSERRATLAAVVIDPARGSLRVTDGPPCTEPWEEIELP
jgi:isopenicillin-N N-acyltransferase-like protein